MKLTNRGSEPVAVHVSGEIAGVKTGRVTLRASGQVVWTGAIDGNRSAFKSAEFMLPAGGATAVEFSMDAPGVRFANGDERVLAFAVYDVDIAVARAGAVTKLRFQNEAWDKFLRRFKLVKKLEFRVGELEGDKADLRRDVADLEKANARLVAEAAEREWVFPPGHFYSPQTSRAEVAEAFARGGFGPPFPGVDLNEAGQVALLHQLAVFYPEQPFPEQPVAGRRYHLDNPSYGHFDGIMLYLMLRHAGRGA